MKAEVKLKLNLARDAKNNERAPHVNQKRKIKRGVSPNKEFW